MLYKKITNFIAPKMLHNFRFMVKFKYSIICQGFSQPGDSEVTFSVIESSCTCFYRFNYSKIKAVPLSALPKDTTSEPAGLSTH